MFILYADEAGNTGLDYDAPQQPVFSLAGIVIEDLQWAEMNKKINALKAEVFGNTDLEIHAAEIFNGKKDKKGKYDFRQYSAEENRGFLEKIVDFVVSLRLPIIYFPVRKSYLKKYCELHFGSGIKIDPYLVGFAHVSSFFDDFLKKRKSTGLIMLDEQNTMVHAVDTTMALLRGDKPTGQYSAKNIIERALFLNSEKNNFIQIADVCNFYINRYISMQHGTKPTPDKAEHFTRMWDKLKVCFVQRPYDPYTVTDFSFIDQMAFFE